MTSRPIASVIVVAFLGGCSTQFIPRAPGRVGVTMEDGKLVYVRDGQRYEHGLFGGGLVDAVHGNAAATTAANEFHGRVRSGFIAGMIGLAATIGGTTFALEEAGNDRGDAALASALVALGGLILAGVGAGYATSAEPYRLDAINIFNDAPPPAAPPGWSASAPKASLRMR